MNEFMGEKVKNVEYIDISKMIVTTESDKRYSVTVNSIKAMPKGVEIYKRNTE